MPRPPPAATSRIFDRELKELARQPLTRADRDVAQRPGGLLRSPARPHPLQGTRGQTIVSGGAIGSRGRK